MVLAQRNRRLYFIVTSIKCDSEKNGFEENVYLLLKSIIRYNIILLICCLIIAKKRLNFHL